jgi:hypothetical protein
VKGRRKEKKEKKKRRKEEKKKRKVQRGRKKEINCNFAVISYFLSILLVQGFLL